MTTSEKKNCSSLTLDVHIQQTSDEPRLTETRAAEREIIRKIDLRLCSIAGILCSLTLLDSMIISNASVTTIFEDLGLGVGNRYSIAILVYTIFSVAFQLPCTFLLRIIGPRVMFCSITVGFGLTTLCTAFVTNWKQMVCLRIILGITQSAIFPGLTLLISTWYKKKEQQLRFAFVQSGSVVFLGLGGILNFGLVHLAGKSRLSGWSWMYLINGLIAIVIGLLTYFWIVEFPENAHNSFRFLSPEEQELAKARIQKDRGDVKLEEFSWGICLSYCADFKLYAFSTLFFLLNLVTTSLAYFLPIILQSGMGFSTTKTILLSAPPYIYAVLPVILTSIAADYYKLRGLAITFNSICTVIGFIMLGFTSQVAIRYMGTFIATGAYVSNWAAINAYQASNILGQWKRTMFAAIIVACSGLGGIAGSFVVIPKEAPVYSTAVWVGIGSHILIILIVALLSLYFWYANRMQKKGILSIENKVGFRYSY